MSNELSLSPNFLTQIHDHAVLEKKSSVLTTLMKLMDSKDKKKDLLKDGLLDIIESILINSVHDKNLTESDFSSIGKAFRVIVLEGEINLLIKKINEIKYNISKLKGKDFKTLIEELAKIIRISEDIFKKKPIGYVFAWISIISEAVNLRIPIPTLCDDEIFNSFKVALSSNRQLYLFLCDLLMKEIYYPLGTIANKIHEKETQSFYMTSEGDRLVMEIHDILEAKKLWAKT